MLSIQRAFLLAFFFCLYVIYGSSIIPTRGSLFRHDPTTDDARCAAYPDPGNIVVSVKTSAKTASIEQLNRIATIFHCLRPDRLILFSDLEQTIGNYKLHDTLSDISSDLLHTHHDFALWRHQQKLFKSGISPRDVTQTPVLSYDLPVDKEEGSKNLDKYKFLHMVEKAWEQQPNKDWYVFADASSYYVWPGLVRYLAEQDPSTLKFISKATRIKQSQLDLPHSDTGFILSGAAVKALMTTGKPITKEWDRKVSFLEAGHHVLAEALQTELNLTLSSIWPLMVGEDVGKIAFQTNIWCEPIIALSNITSDLALRLLNREQAFKYASRKEFLTFGDLFKEISFTSPATLRVIPDSQTSYTSIRRWANLAELEEKEWAIKWQDAATQDSGLIADMPENPNKSPDECAKACDAFRDCIQFSHMSFDARFIINDKEIASGGLCYLSRLYRFGAYRAVNQWEDDGNDGRNPRNSVSNTQVWVSGWNQKRWDAFSAKLTESCSATM
ncbi:hypothetical protein CAC42_963 [Sphaceloma murrayae]|uniref:Glycosyltransferase family 31 protein n=1 Tax=Sphaceloma murrayae TaxID=2082308 RepID=A0A2K1R2T7_9PEZI|nr:hypothetical protein CAC42_963 [Sphaceloma murrayae]